jgi:mRNA degradation ribonuclease J1/J2
MRTMFRDHPDRRIIVASFASHLHRVQQVSQAAINAGRRVAFLGRSMTQNVALAREMGLLDVPTDRVIDIEEVPRYAPGEVCVVCTGSQGEPLSALALMAAHEHKYIKVSEEDVVVISAHAIPGNEFVYARDRLLYRAAPSDPRWERVYPRLARAGEELKFLLDIVQPDWFVPVHGVTPPKHALAGGRRRSRPRAREDGDAQLTSRRDRRTGGGAPRGPAATSTSTASLAMWVSGCCVTGATSPKRDSWWSSSRSTRQRGRSSPVPRS